MSNDEISSIGELRTDLSKLTSIVFDYYNKLKYDITNLQYQISALKNKVIPLDLDNNKVILRVGDKLINIEVTDRK